MPDNLGNTVSNRINELHNTWQTFRDNVSVTANTASDTIRDWVTTNMYNEWNQIRENITYRDAEIWSEVFRAFEFDSSEDKNEDIEEENELLDEFLSEFAVKGDDNK